MRCFLSGLLVFWNYKKYTYELIITILKGDSFSEKYVKNNCAINPYNRSIYFLDDEYGLYTKKYK